MSEICGHAIWVGFRSHRCSRPAKFAITEVGMSASTVTRYRCGFHIRRFKDHPKYDVKPVSANGDPCQK